MAGDCPYARMVAPHQRDADGIVVFTKCSESPKGRDSPRPRRRRSIHWRVAAAPRPGFASRWVLCSTRPPGTAYLPTRHPQSRIGAWAGPAIAVAGSRARLGRRGRSLFGLFSAKRDSPGPLLAGCIGLAARTDRVLQNGDFRLHDRVCIRAGGRPVSAQRLFP